MEKDGDDPGAEEKQICGGEGGGEGAGRGHLEAGTHSLSPHRHHHDQHDQHDHHRHHQKALIEGIWKLVHILFLITITTIIMINMTIIVSYTIRRSRWAFSTTLLIKMIISFVNLWLDSKSLSSSRSSPSQSSYSRSKSSSGGKPQLRRIPGGNRHRALQPGHGHEGRCEADHWAGLLLVLLVLLVAMLMMIFVILLFIALMIVLVLMMILNVGTQLQFQNDKI